MIHNGYCDNETINLPSCNYDGFDCCINPDLIGDGFCDDDINNPDCNFDGGDCCGPCINREHCTDCECLEESNLTDSGISNPLVGDGTCQSEVNNPFCSYDGGDCCGPETSRENCHQGKFH